MSKEILEAYKNVEKCTIDFLNKSVTLKVKDKEQQDHFHCFIEKEALKAFYPSKNYIDIYDSFTWDFDNNLFAANQTSKWPEGVISSSKESITEIIVPMQGLSKRLMEFLGCIRIEDYFDL